MERHVKISKLYVIELGDYFNYSLILLCKQHTWSMFQYGTILAKLSVTFEQPLPSNITIGLRE